MTDLRDKFAIAAVQGLLASDIPSPSSYPRYVTKGKVDAEKLATDAYRIADAMLRLVQPNSTPLST